MLKGFTPPFTPRGLASLVPPPPWHYAGWLLNVDFACDRERAAAFVPTALGAATGRGTVHFGRLAGHHGRRGAARSRTVAVPGDHRGPGARAAGRFGRQLLSAHLRRSGRVHAARPAPGLAEEDGKHLDHPLVSARPPRDLHVHSAPQKYIQRSCVDRAEDRRALEQLDAAIVHDRPRQPRLSAVGAGWRASMGWPAEAARSEPCGGGGHAARRRPCCRGVFVLGHGRAARRST